MSGEPPVKRQKKLVIYLTDTDSSSENSSSGIYLSTQALLEPSQASTLSDGQLCNYLGIPEYIAQQDPRAYEQRKQYWKVVEEHSIWHGIKDYLDPPEQSACHDTIPQGIPKLECNIGAALAWEQLSDLTEIDYQTK